MTSLAQNRGACRSTSCADFLAHVQVHTNQVGEVIDEALVFQISVLCERLQVPASCAREPRVFKVGSLVGVCAHASIGGNPFRVPGIRQQLHKFQFQYESAGGKLVRVVGSAWSLCLQTTRARARSACCAQHPHLAAPFLATASASSREASLASSPGPGIGCRLLSLGV